MNEERVGSGNIGADPTVLYGDDESGSNRLGQMLGGVGKQFGGLENVAFLHGVYFLSLVVGRYPKINLQIAMHRSTMTNIATNTQEAILAFS